MTRRLNSEGSEVKRVSFGGVGAVEKRRENAHCDGKVFGDKGGNGLSLALR